MNEPLGDREILCVSQFTPYGDARKGHPQLPGATGRTSASGRVSHLHIVSFASGYGPDRWFTSRTVSIPLTAAVSADRRTT